MAGFACALALTACGSGGSDGPGADGSAADGSAADGAHRDGGSDGSPTDGAQGDGRSDGSAEDGAQGDGRSGGSDAGAPPDVDACVGQAEAGDTETQRLLFAGGGATVGVVRHIDPDSIGTSGTQIWIADVFAVSAAGERACVTDAAQLTHRISRHNVEDAVTATAESATFTLTLPGASLTRTEGGTTGEPVQLNLTRCTRLNDDTPCTIHAGP